jgi:transposase
MTTKLYCGLDFHKNSAEICVLDQMGSVIEQTRVKSERLVQYLSNRKDYYIGVEASGGVFDITAKLEASGHNVTIINPTQFRAIGITGKKNDKNDAKALATALRLGFVPEVHKKTLYSRRIKSLLTSRDLVVRTRTQIINHVRGILREYGLPMPSGVTAFWEQVQLRIRELECEVMRQVLQSIVDQAAALKDQEVVIEAALQALTQEDERIARLESVPGVGRLTAMAFVATFDDVARFPNAKRAGAFLGLTPRENSSGNKIRFGSITKCGPELVRRYLIHGARSSMRYAPTPENKIRLWADRVEKRVGTNKAVVALAHKNARICFALLRDGTSFGEGKKPKAKVA